jgi:hypothetical protein
VDNVGYVAGGTSDKGNIAATNTRRIDVLQAQIVPASFRLSFIVFKLAANNAPISA